MQSIPGKACGECSFCSLSMHQGRIVQSRTPGSILEEIRKISADKKFRTRMRCSGPGSRLSSACRCSALSGPGSMAVQPCPAVSLTR